MGTVQLFKHERLAIYAVRGGDQKIHVIRIETGPAQGPKHSGEIYLKEPFELPGDLVEPKNAANGRLVTWKELQAAIKAERDERRFEIVRKLEEARDNLRVALAERSIDTSVAAGGFFGINGLTLAVSTEIKAHLTIDLLKLDPALKLPAETPVLTATLEANGEVLFNGQSRNAGVRFEVVATAGAVVQALPSISIDRLGNLFAPLDFSWPTISFEGLKWDGLPLKGLLKLLRLDLPLPSLGTGLTKIGIEWNDNDPPQFALTVEANRRLSIATKAARSGKLVVELSGASHPIAKIENLTFALTSDGSVALTGEVTREQDVSVPLKAITLNQPEALPFVIELAAGTIDISMAGDIDLAQGNANATIEATLNLPRVTIRAKSDPALLLALYVKYRFCYEAATGKSGGQLTHLEVTEPYPLKLMALAAQEAVDLAQSVIQMLGAIPIPTADVPRPNIAAVLERILAMLGEAVKWLAARAGEAVDSLLGIAEAVVEALGKLLKNLCDYISKPQAPRISLPYLLFEVRLDSRTYALRQLIVSPGWEVVEPGKVFEGDALGLHFSIPLDWRPVLLIDFVRPISVALVVRADSQNKFTLGTDLWLANDSGVEAVRDTDEHGKRDEHKRLISVSVAPKGPHSISLLRWSGGRVTFLEALSPDLEDKEEVIDGRQIKVTRSQGRQAYFPLKWSGFKADVKADIEKGKARLLPFLQSSEGSESSGSSFLDSVGQYIEITAGDVSKQDDEESVVLPLQAKLKFAGTQLDFDLQLKVNLRTFVTKLGGDRIVINGKKENAGFTLLGLQGVIVNEEHKDWTPTKDTYPFFALDFPSGGDARLSLAKEARMALRYNKIASSGGEGLRFVVSELALSRGGLDLEAAVSPEKPVRLAGVDVPFRFDAGALSIKRNKIQAFAIRGSGQLPPELVGEANATIGISMGRNSRGGLIVQSAEAKLDKSDDPIVCQGTRFTLTLSAIGLEFRDFSGEGSGYHFYFTLTGSAQFVPRPGEFTNGLLKNFGSLTITLDKAPLAGDSSMLMRAIEFQVAVEPKKRINFFNLFSFELRGIGFHPASPAFKGDPAMSISGQVSFAEAGDIVSPRFDFHKLWIAKAKKGSWQPRVRFDGLTVGVRFGSSVSVEATAMTVDRDLPSLFAPGALPPNVTTSGFLASGKLSIKGWASMSAAMGFLELDSPRFRRPRHAFFVYAQQDRLSYEIPTPLGSIYLREVGFGFGFRYTLAAFNRADQVTSVQELIQVLDDISRYQGDLASIKSWEPEADGNRVTLALRGMISMTSASTDTEYNESGEKDLANPVLFDVVAALRSDLTFFLNARVWLCFNYADWDTSSQSDAWRTRPTLRGYTYLSVPRKEFLARLISDGTGIVGAHPQLPEPIVEAMKGIRWSATTYIRPGLFHQEFGWPYELSFTFEKEKYCKIVCEGGLVNRIEDGSMLFGVAFRAKGFAELGGRGGGRSCGTSITARADFSLDVKFISFVSIKRFSDSLFYGALSIASTIKFAIKFWINTKLFSASVGFSQYFTLSLALETVVSPKAIGGRGSASIGVRALGRGLRVSAGVSFNDSALREARARVQRFMSLGLTVDTPDAEKGVTPPAVESPRGPSVVAADAQIDQAMQESDEVRAPLPRASAEGRDLQPTGYWAMLFPVTGSSDDYVMVFLPRDDSPTGLKSSQLQRSKFPTHAEENRLGAFFPPPPVGDPKHDEPLVFSNLHSDTPVELTYLDPGAPDSGGAPATEEPFKLAPGAEKSLKRIEWPIRGDADEVLPSFALLRACFVETGGAFKEPLTIIQRAGVERLPDTREAAAQMLMKASRDMEDLNVELEKAHEIEERRSGVIAALSEGAASLAAGGVTAWSERPTSGLDPRTMSLAFVVKRTSLDALFEHVAGGGPRPAKFHLHAKDIATQMPMGMATVHLFNPPERHFETAAPRLAEPILEATPSGVRLDWDLEPAFGGSDGVWNDPEFMLKHYRIERIVTSEGDLESLVAPRAMTSKAGAPVRMVLNPITRKVEWGFLRPQAQFIDDLSDLSDKVRRNVLPSALGRAAESSDDASADDPRDAGWDPVWPVLDEGQIRLLYTIVPVDIAGTSAPPTILSVVLRKRKAPRPSVKRGLIAFEYEAIRDIDAQTPAVKIFLGFDDGVDPPADKPSVFPLGIRTYRLRVRTERGVPSGLYGADALSDARARPSAADFAVRHEGDRDYLIKFQPVRGDRQRERPGFDVPMELALTTKPDADAPPGYSISIEASEADALADLKSVLEISTTGGDRKEIVGARFAIRPEGETHETVPWCTMDIVMRATASSDAPVGTSVEVFEHLLEIESAPLMFNDLKGRSGRVVTLFPSEDGSLRNLLRCPAAKSAADAPGLPRETKPGLPRFFADPARRVGTLIGWSSRPTQDDPMADSCAANRLAPWFGGFNICELDASAETEGSSAAPVIVVLRYEFSKKTEGEPEKNQLQLILNSADQAQSQAAGLLASRFTGEGNRQQDRSPELKAINADDHEVRGRVRLVSVNRPGKWLELELTARTEAKEHHRFALIPLASSDSNPFKDGEYVDLIYKGFFAARHVARVQALPLSLAQLDPHEIADFAKIEARYPSESWRVSPEKTVVCPVQEDHDSSKLGISPVVRRRAWYSPAESFVVWPASTLRRSLALNVDEVALAELLSGRTPSRFRILLKVGGQDLHVMAGDKQPENGIFEPTTRTIAGFRSLLRDVVCDTSKVTTRSVPELQNALLKVDSLDDDEQTLVHVELPVDLMPQLHPVIADVIDEMRYVDTPDRESLSLRLLNRDADFKQFTLALVGNATRVEFELERWPRDAAERELPVPVLRLPHVRTPAGKPALLLRASDEGNAQRVCDAIDALITRLPSADRAKIDSALFGTNLGTPALKVTVLSDEAQRVIELSIVAESVLRDPQRTQYRRFEPVLEPTPKPQSVNVSAWFDDTPTDRDPYGWGVLRTLGLATGLRLYDTEEREFASPETVLKQLDAAFTKIVKRYPGLVLGAPFAEIITRPGGTMEVTSFDGGLPGFGCDDVKGLLNGKALALIQFGLRPVASPMVPEVEEAPVAYFAIQNRGGSALTFELQNSVAFPNEAGAMEILDLTPGFGAPRPVTLVPTPDQDDIANKRLHDALLDGADDRTKLAVDISLAEQGAAVALVRVIAARGSAAALGRKWLQSTEGAVQIPAPSRCAEHSAFGRFPELTEKRFGALAAKFAAVKDAAGKDTLATAVHEGHPAIRAAIDTFKTYCIRRWPEGWPVPEQENVLTDRLPEWTRRFLDHGTAKRLAPRRNVPDGQDLELSYALAEVTRPDPWRVAVQSDHSMEILITHDDRKRRVKRYAVRPFGRYEPFVEALRKTRDSAASDATQQTLVNWTDYVRRATQPDSVAPDFDQRFVDIVIHRTEPMAPPVLVDAKRIAISPAQQNQPASRMLEFIYSRHPEEILSEANVSVAGALSFEGVSVGLWREFAAQRWAQDLSNTIDTTEEFGSGTVPPPLPLIDSVDPFGGLIGTRDAAGRFPDGWRGALVLRTAPLPYFFRVHAVAFASAGVVVSDLVTATIPEGHYDLNLPWKQDLLGHTLERPRWSVSRDVRGVVVSYWLPLVRFVDGMPADTLDTWLAIPGADPGDTPIPTSFTLPDPAVRYEIQLVAEDEAGLQTSSTELDVIGEESAPNQQDPSAYRVNVVGPQYDPRSAAKPAPLGCWSPGPSARTTWFVTADAMLTGGATALTPKFLPAIENPEKFGEFELPPEAFAADSVWTTVMPTRAHEVVLDVPGNTTPVGWKAFRKNVAKPWADAVEPYIANAAALEIHTLLTDAATLASTQWWKSRGWVKNGKLRPGTLPVTAFAAGLPHLADGRPPQISVKALEGSKWAWPPSVDAGIDSRVAIGRLKPVARTDGITEEEFIAALRTPIRLAMRQLQIARNEPRALFTWNAGDTQRALQPARSVVTGNLAEKAIEMAVVLEKIQAFQQFQFLDVLQAISIKVQNDQQGTVYELIRAIETHPGTSSAIESFGALEDGSVEAVIRLTVRVAQHQDVAPLLQQLSTIASADEATIVCYVTPTDDERALIIEAIGAAIPEDPELRRRLRAVVEPISTAHIFGLHGKPQLRIYHGNARPQRSPIDARTGGID